MGNLNIINIRILKILCIFFKIEKWASSVICLLTWIIIIFLCLSKPSPSLPFLMVMWYSPPAWMYHSLFPGLYVGHLGYFHKKAFQLEKNILARVLKFSKTPPYNKQQRVNQLWRDICGSKNQVPGSNTADAHLFHQLWNKGKGLEGKAFLFMCWRESQNVSQIYPSHSLERTA